MTQEKKQPGDIIAVDPETGAYARNRDGEISFGSFRPVKEGTPLHEGEESIRISKIGENVYKVTDSYRQGPAKVSTRAYRDNWDTIFGPQPVGEA